MNPQNKTRALAARALIDLHQAHCCQKSKGSALFNLASAIMIQLFAEKYTITPYGSFPNCKRAANFYGNESLSKLTTESGTNECSTVSIEGSWRFPHMFSLSFVLAGDATRNKLCSKPFRDLITQILHFPPDQRKGSGFRVPCWESPVLWRLPGTVTSTLPSEQEPHFTTADPNATSASWPGCRGNPALPGAGRAQEGGRQAMEFIHCLCSSTAWLCLEPKCGTAPLSARGAISSC